jgi:hypothetical protein
MHSLEPAHLAAGAGEDRAALSGRPRKANAGQYATVMPQRNPVRHRDPTMQPERSCPFVQDVLVGIDPSRPHQG